MVKNSIGNKAHTRKFVDPMERYYFSGLEMFEKEKEFLGISGDILCDPLDLSMLKDEYLSF